MKSGQRVWSSRELVGAAAATALVHVQPKVAYAPGFQGKSRREVRELVKAAGGTYSGDLIANKTDVLVQAKAAELQHSQKVSKARAWNIPLVGWSWLADSHATGTKCDLQAYSHEAASSASPPKVESSKGLSRSSTTDKARQALQDSTNLHQLPGQMQTAGSKPTYSVQPSSRCMPHLSHRSARSHQQDSFEPPDVELPRRAITTRQERSWRSSLASISSAEDPQACINDSTPQPLPSFPRPPSPDAFSASASAGQGSSEGSPSSSASILPDVTCFSECNQHSMNLDVDLDRLSLDPSTTCKGHHSELLPNRQIRRLPVQTPACHASSSKEQSASTCVPPILPSTAAQASLTTPFGQCQHPAKNGNTAPELRRSQLALENVTSRKHARPLPPSDTAISTKTAVTCTRDRSLDGRTPYAAAQDSCSLPCSPGESTASASFTAALGSTASALPGAAAPGAALYPSDGRVQPLRMLARPPRGNTVRAFHGLKHIKEVPFAELLQLQVCHVNVHVLLVPYPLSNGDLSCRLSAACSIFRGPGSSPCICIWHACAVHADISTPAYRSCGSLQRPELAVMDQAFYP